jgi:acyl-coenzyme A thioesterase 13
MQTENKQLQLLQSKVGLTMKEGLSPYGRWIAGKLINAEFGRVSFEIEVREDMTNPLQMLHGGATAGIVDEVIGIAVFSLGRPNFYTTINLVIDYFATAKLADIVVATATIVKPGNNIINVKCEIWDITQKKLLVTSSSNLMKIEQTFGM